MSLLSCAACGARARSVCSKCYLTGYCNTACQARDYAAHARECHDALWRKDNVHELSGALPAICSVVDPWLRAHETGPNVALPAELRHQVRDVLLVNGLAFRAKMLAKLKFGKSTIDEITQGLENDAYTLDQLRDIAAVLQGRFLSQNKERRQLLLAVQRRIGAKGAQEKTKE